MGPRGRAVDGSCFLSTLGLDRQASVASPVSTLGPVGLELEASSPMGPRGHTVVGSCFLLYAGSGQPGFRGLTRVYTGSSWPWSGPWISPDAHPFRTLLGVGRRGCLPGSLRLTALLGAESAHPSLDVQLVLELPVGPRLPGPGLFPADEAVGLVAADGDIVGSVVLLCKRPPPPPGDTCDAECLPWTTEGRPVSAIPTGTGAPDFTRRREQVPSLQ